MTNEVRQSSIGRYIDFFCYMAYAFSEKLASLYYAILTIEVY